MKKNICAKIIYIIFVICIVFINCNNIFATDYSSIYGPITSGRGNVAVSNPLSKSGGIIIGTIKWIGVAVLIGAVIVKGIKYVTISPEGKAQIKQEIIMLSIGALILFSFGTLIDIVYEMVANSGMNS